MIISTKNFIKEHIRVIVAIATTLCIGAVLLFFLTDSNQAAPAPQTINEEFVAGVVQDDPISSDAESHALSSLSASESATPSDETVTDVQAEAELNEAVEPDEIANLINQMTIYEKIGQLFIARLPNNQRARNLIENYHIGGFIFFSEHVSSIQQVQQTISDLQEASEIPLFIAVDEEGGRVSRVGRLFAEGRIATAFNIGSTGEPQRAYDAYYYVGQNLRYLGFNMNFAPVADIWTNPANTVIGDRAFGTEPELVAKMTEAAVRGLRDSGVLAVIKHFPGHGDTVEDSHYNLAFYHHDRERFNQIEAIPFQRGIEVGTDGVMIGHIATPLFGTGNLPATFSSYLMEQVLRYEWGFEGLIITDALDMRGLTNYYTHDEIVINAFVNGADVLLMPTNPEQAITAMIEAYREGRFNEERLHESLRRILESKRKF